MRRSLPVVVLLLLVALVPAAVAQEDASPPVPLADLKGKTGGHHARLAERSPLSVDLKAVAKRLGMSVPAATPPTPPARPAVASKAVHALRQTVAPANPTASTTPPPVADVTDYDLAKETFYVYVPPEAGPDGKYGLMVGQCFKPYDAPPKAWSAVLDAHHLIWIGARDAGDGRAPVQRVGLLLDAAHDAAKVWPVDADRVYLSMMTFAGPTAATAMDYPDVFGGEIQSVGVPWYAKIKTTGKTPLTYNTDDFPQPAGKYLGAAKSHSRFYLAPRVDSAADVQWDVVVKRGYKSAGFRYVKAEPVPGVQMAEYTDLGADWFDHGVTFLDAPLVELKAKAKPATMPVAKPLPPLSAPAAN